jgi:putative two-component system response regulator
MKKHSEDNILIVDDESSIRELFLIWLEEAGYTCFSADSAQKAIDLINKENFSLIISDINMPGMTGIELLEHIKENYHDNVAVLMVTAVHDRDLAIQALRTGAYGYLNKPVDQNEMIVNVVDALERRRLVLVSKSYQEMLEAEVRRQTEALRKREEEISLRLVSAAEYRDDETGSHIRRIGLVSASLAKEMGLDTSTVDDIRIAAPMHDIGKIGVPDNILRKPGRLTPEEFNIVKEHTTIGAQILDGSDIRLIRMAKDIALYHHERWNGMGYPTGLSGEDIPLYARIVAVVDVFDALSSPRVYKPAFSVEKTVGIIKAERGEHFDPQVLDVFLTLLPSIREIYLSV